MASDIDATPRNGNGIKARAFEWLFQQGVSTVLLVAILFWVGWGIRYAIETGIPNHLRMIQEGYDRNAQTHKDTVKELIDEQREELKYARRHDRDDPPK